MGERAIKNGAIGADLVAEHVDVINKAFENQED